MRILLTGCILAAAATLSAQEFLGERDFLTQYEIEVIRETQEPNERIAAYLSFAALRLELASQLLAKEEAGRGAKIHDNLEDFGRILETIDMVVDDALVRDVDLTKSVQPLVDQETVFLGKLKAIQESDPEDLWRFEFALEDAIEIASDSIEMATEDLGARKRNILEDDDAERQSREASMSAARKKEVDKDKKGMAVEKETFESKRPSLLKPGETLDTQGAKDKKK